MTAVGKNRDYNKKAEYYLGIDGGGTKTEFLLTDLSKKEIKGFCLGTSNPVNGSLDNTYSVLSQGIEKCCNGIDIGTVSVFAGIAGVKSGDNERLINNFLSRFGFYAFLCSSDIDVAIELCLKGGNGTAVIMGTGIAAFSRRDDKLYRTGGRGYMIDKGGSGFHFGSDALNSAFEAIDGRNGSKILSELIEERLGCPLEKGISEIYKGGAAAVASFAPVVFEAYRMGDVKAAEIIEKNAKEAASVINGALNISANTEKNVVICGGLSCQKEILSDFIKKYLAEDVRLRFCEERMVNAAVSLAEKLSGGKLC